MSIRKSHCAGRQTVLIAFLLLCMLFSFSFAASASADEVFEFTTISGTFLSIAFSIIISIGVSGLCWWFFKHKRLV